uniref:Ig-like domain-containing protein n=2 Tax=Oncorhynchus mykiss TaxID=8022 RepID=A0A8C7LPK6_ONCMY
MLLYGEKLIVLRHSDRGKRQRNIHTQRQRRETEDRDRERQRETERERIMADVPQSFLGLLVTVLYLLTGVSGETLSMFSRVEDNVSLPCNNVVYPDCSSTIWIYNRAGSTGTIQKVTLGKIKSDQTERADRLSVGSNCSLHVSDVRAEDVGLYTCRQFLTETGPQHGGDADVDLSVLTILSTTPVTDLKPNVNMTLRCSLLTDTGNRTCQSRFSLSWVPKTGTNAQVTQDSSCDITLSVTLQKKDNNRKWTCTLTGKGNVKISIDFTSTFSDIEEKTTDSDDVISTVPGSTASTARPALSTTSPSSSGIVFNTISLHSCIVDCMSGTAWGQSQMYYLGQHKAYTVCVYAV